MSDSQQNRSPGLPKGVPAWTLFALVLAWVLPAVLLAQDATPVTAEALAAAAAERTTHRVVYDGSYRRLDYPGGDVPDSVGVCTDVIIRSYRALGIDLQQKLHEDMRRHFDAYPDLWRATRPDRNIDHRRVPNLRVFLTRYGTVLPVTDDPDAYLTGDLVTWLLPRNLPHIGIVAAARSEDGLRPLIIHNVGAGPRSEDVLFSYPVTGHYRYFPDHRPGDDP